MLQEMKTLHVVSNIVTPYFLWTSHLSTSI